METGHRLYDFVTEALNCRSTSVKHTEHNNPEVLQDFHIPFSATPIIEELTALVCMYFLIEEPTLKFLEGKLTSGLLLYSELVDKKQRLISVSINRIVGHPTVHVTVIDFNKTKLDVKANL